MYVCTCFPITAKTNPDVSADDMYIHIHPTPHVATTGGGWVGGFAFFFFLRRMRPVFCWLLLLLSSLLLHAEKARRFTWYVRTIHTYMRRTCVCGKQASKVVMSTSIYICTCIHTIDTIHARRLIRKPPHRDT